MGGGTQASTRKPKGSSVPTDNPEGKMLMRILFSSCADTFETFMSDLLYEIYLEAAAEFQKILDHRGIVLNEPIGALAHLQIGRAYAMQGDTAKAKAAYQDFLALWKDADPDIPILMAAKAEYAKLQ
jgi:hypothetical protein